MTEKIMLLPGANATELTRMLARFHKNSLGLRIMNATEFARFALMRSGIVLEETFLPRKQEAAVIDGFLRSIPYFASAAYADAEKLADALGQLRSLIPAAEARQIHEKLPLGEFPEKNNSLVNLYDQYMATLKATGSIDTIGLLRKAMAEAKPLTCPVYTLREYPCSPLETAMLARLAPEQANLSLVEFLGVEATTLQNIDYTESYGSSNEVEAIYHYIVRNNIPFDECTVAVASPSPYAQLFYDFSQRNGLAITLGCGIPILNANPARVLKLLYDWNNTGYHGVDALRALLCSDALDRKKLFDALGIEHTRELDTVINVAGQLRLSFQEEENNRKLACLPKTEKIAPIYPCVVALSKELALGESKWIEKFALIRDGVVGRVDRSALSVICDTLDAYAKYSGGRPLNMIIPEILQRSVCSENSREGALFVTGISGAMASMRKHLFVVGMSASNFPGTPRENYLLLDSDYSLFADRKTAPTSINLVQRKKDGLEQLLALASALEVSIHISYSGYDLAALKEENPSSVLFDIFKQQYGNAATLKEYKKCFRHVGYFDQQVSGDYTVGRAYTQQNEILSDAPDHSEAACAYTKNTAFSPSALDVFFQCPRRFFLTRILGVQEVEEDDPFTVMSGAEIGLLAHKLMEGLFHAPCDRDVFLQRADEAFAQALRLRPPLHPDAAAAEKLVFRKMMANAYEQDPGNEVLASEEEQHFLHSSGILLKGYPDRVEKTPAGQYIIADYKSGRSIKHIPDDIDTCLQVVIYAYLLESHGKAISHCEYRYLRDKQTVTCRYDEDMKEKLNQKLLAFKEALTSGNFPCATDEDACTYCTLAGICGKETQKEEEADEC